MQWKNKTLSTLVQHKYGITYGFMPKPCSTCLASYGEKCNNLQLCLKVLMIGSTPEKKLHLSCPHRPWHHFFF